MHWPKVGEVLQPPEAPGCSFGCVLMGLCLTPLPPFLISQAHLTHLRPPHAPPPTSHIPSHLTHLGSPSLSVEQAPVGLDLLLQACLDVQQAFILGLLALRLTPNLTELFLQATNLCLDSRQPRPVASFGVSQAPFQRAFL